jgi:hypothetical protein
MTVDMMWRAGFSAGTMAERTGRAVDGAARELERLASALHALAFDMAEPARSHGEADRRIAEGERISAAVRAVVRGRPTSS